MAGRRLERVPGLAIAIVIAAAACLAFEGRSMAAVPASSGFSPNLRINDGTSPFPDQVEPYLVADPQGRLFVGWKEADTATGPGERVGFARSLDGGATWSPSLLMALSNSKLRASDPWLAMDEGGRLYFSRVEFPNHHLSPEPVIVSSSDDGGANWRPTVNVDDQMKDFTDKESIAADGAGTVYAAFSDETRTSGCECILLAHSTDRGATWSPTVRVSDGGSSNLGAAIAARPDGRVTVLWWDAVAGDVLADTSFDHGQTWSVDVRVNGIPGSVPFDPASVVMPFPSVVSTSTGTLFAGWADRRTGDWDIRVARSDDGGRSWSAAARVNDDTSGREQWQPAVTVDGRDKVHLAWLDNRTGNWNVFYATSKDGGHWSSNLRVTDAETPSTFTRPGDFLGLAVDTGGNVSVAWTDGRNGNLDIYFARLPAATATGAGALDGIEAAALEPVTTTTRRT